MEDESTVLERNADYACQVSCKKRIIHIGVPVDVVEMDLRGKKEPFIDYS